jgi:hypothetical protein
LIWINKEIIQLAHNYLTKTDSGDQHARQISRSKFTRNARRQAEITGDRASQRIDSRIDNRVTVLRSRLNAGFVKKPDIFFTHCNRVATGARIFQSKTNQSISGSMTPIAESAGQNSEHSRF